MLFREREEKTSVYKREIETLLECDHPNVVKLIEPASNSKSEKFLVMEYCQYDLKRFLQIHPRLETPLIKNFLGQILEGLNYLHGKNIIHRDLKSANLLV